MLQVIQILVAASQGERDVPHIIFPSLLKFPFPFARLRYKRISYVASSQPNNDSSGLQYALKSLDFWYFSELVHDIKILKNFE